MGSSLQVLPRLERAELSCQSLHVDVVANDHTTGCIGHKPLTHSVVLGIRPRVAELLTTARTVKEGAGVPGCSPGTPASGVW
jgi:hypothetical protein